MTRNTKKPAATAVTYNVVELDGVPYAIVRASVLRDLCDRAGVQARPSNATPNAGEIEPLDHNLDRTALARRLLTRRKRAGLTQTDLARRAGIRVETLNRIERGHTTPDFATVRKLVVAMNQIEQLLPEESASADHHHP